MDTNIILIGPLSAGKTTVGKLLGEALNLPVVELDDLRWDYYKEIGYDHEHAEQLAREGGLAARTAYWKPFEAYSVERMLQDYPAGYVLPLGGGHSVYEDPAQFERVQKALEPYPYVIFLLPSTDKEESLRLLAERFQAEEPNLPLDIFRQVAELNRGFVEHPSNAILAKFTVYTAGKSAEETCADVLMLVRE